MYQVRVIEDFAAAHFLENYHGKCENLHGHNYKVWVTCRGESLDEGGMLLDFGVLKNAVRQVLKTLDHTLLNELPAFADGRPSAERIAEYIYKEVKALLPEAPLHLVEVSETDRNIAGYGE